MTYLVLGLVVAMLLGFGCCCGETCQECSGGSAPEEVTVTLSGVAASDPLNCQQCADVNDTYILTAQPVATFGDGACTGEGPSCHWRWEGDGDCGLTNIDLWLCKLASSGDWALALTANTDGMDFGFGHTCLGSDIDWTWDTGTSETRPDCDNFDEDFSYSSQSGGLCCDYSSSSANVTS